VAQSIPLDTGNGSGVGLLATGGLVVGAVGYFPAGYDWLHVTWLVNSATQYLGSRRFDTKDDSRNNWWLPC